MVGGTSYFSLDSGRSTGETPAAARSFADFAVLYRLSAQSRLLIEAFDRSGIPYQTVGQTPLYAHKAVREVLAHLWLLHNPRSQVHASAGRRLDHDAIQRIAAQRWREAAERRRAGRAADRADQRRDRGSDASRTMLRRRAACSQLALRATPFGDRLADFLEATALQSETDAYDPRADRVTLMSLHASKGLEFPVVFIVGCEEGLLPYVRVARSKTGHSEDVAYVRVARSKTGHSERNRQERPQTMAADGYRRGAAAVLRGTDTRRPQARPDPRGEARPFRPVHGERAVAVRGRYRGRAEGDPGEAVSAAGAESGERADEFVLSEGMTADWQD